MPFLGRVIFVLSVNILAVQDGFTQNQKLADSLISELKKVGSRNDSLRFDLLSKISFNHNNPDSSLHYSRLLALESAHANDQKWSFIAYYNEGSALRLKGNLDSAIRAYFKSLEYTNQGIDIKNEAKSYLAIGDVYSISGANDNSIKYYKKAISLLRSANDSILLATALLNIGDEYFNSKHLDSALFYFEESGKIFDQQEYIAGKAYNLGNIGMVYANMNKNNLAEQYIDEAISILEDLEDYYPICVYLTYMSDIYMEKGDEKTAENYANRSLSLALKYGLKEQISDANLKLSEILEQAGNLKESLEHYKAHVTYRDSVNNIETVQQIADLRTDFEVAQKQVEVDLLNQQRKSQRIINIAASITSVLILILAIGLYRRYKYIKETNQIIEKEKDRSEKLLLNILPEETALELKEKGEVQAKKFDSVTVLFSDFKDFTRMSGTIEPEQLVKSIDFYFKAFDEITTRYNLEKIKTIGDAYMCAGGIPTENQHHAKNIVRAAIEMIDFVRGKLSLQDDLVHFEIRIGVHTGPVVAGIVGLNKWQYDIWGDTVNIASRMESNSEPGKINISESTYSLIKDDFDCEYRGEMDAKNKGMMKMYFVNGLKGY